MISEFLLLHNGTVLIILVTFIYRVGQYLQADGLDQYIQEFYCLQINMSLPWFLPPMKKFKCLTVFVTFIKILPSNYHFLRKGKLSGIFYFYKTILKFALLKRPIFKKKKYFSSKLIWNFLLCVPGVRHAPCRLSFGLGGVPLNCRIPGSVASDSVVPVPLVWLWPRLWPLSYWIGGGGCLRAYS